MVVEAIPNPVFGVFYAVLLTLIAVFLFRGIHDFYDELKVYHKIPSDYHPIAAHKGDPPDGYEIEDFVPKGMSRQGTELEIREHESLTNQVDPEIIIDFDDREEIIYYGESPIRKIVYLSFYLGVSSLIPQAIVVLYFMHISSINAFSVGASAFKANLGVFFMIVSLHLGIRIATLAKISTYNSEQEQDKYQSDLHDFAFSFFMSLYVVWAFTIVIISFISGLDGGAIGNIPPRLLAVFVLEIFSLPVIAAVVGYVTLRYLEVPEHLMDDREHDSVPIHEC